MPKTSKLVFLSSLLIFTAGYTTADSHSQTPASDTPTLVVAPSPAETDPDLMEAVMQYFISLAKSGSDYSQLSLGEAYLEGTLGPVDYVQAFAWLSTAQGQGLSEAAPLIDRAWAAMNANERQAAATLAAEYRQWINP